MRYLSGQYFRSVSVMFKVGACSVRAQTPNMFLRKVISASSFQYLALALIASTMAGCIPIPYFQREAPAIEGTISRSGTPVENVKVGLAVNQQFEPNCSGAKQETLTNVNGRFHVEETKQLLPVFMCGDRWDSWSLCFKFPDGAKVVWRDGGWWGGPPLQHLECNFREELKSSVKPLQVDMQGGGKLSDVCSLKEVQRK